MKAESKKAQFLFYPGDNLEAAQWSPKVILYLGLLFFLPLMLALNVLAQSVTGTITGRILTEDGQPLAHTMVNLIGMGGKRPIAMTVVADDEGNFVVNGLDPIPFLISVWVPGYVTTNNLVINPFDPNKAHFHHIGESVTITMVRGGVVTGRVVDVSGEPIVGVPVKAIRIHDELGTTVSVPNSSSSQTQTTDDRGIYRIYGLAPGSYVVAAGGVSVVTSRPTPFVGRTIIYYPSSTREAARLVKVSSGAELTSIDIQYRGENGFVISGKITDGRKGNTDSASYPVTILLRHSTTRDIVATTSFGPANNQYGYTFYGIPNGDYEMIAETEGTEETPSMISIPRRITVRNANIIGLELKLIPTASISGTISIEKASPSVPKCKKTRNDYPQEIIVKARRNDPGEKPESVLSVSPTYGIGVPDGNGAFAIQNLKPGKHHIELQLVDETLYLKMMLTTGTLSRSDPRMGIAVKSGDKLTGLKLTIMSGASSLKGKVTMMSPAIRPSLLRIYLVPAETQMKTDLLRFAETCAEDNGSFTFTNIAPGKYFILSKSLSDSEVSNKVPLPIMWDATERAKILREAESSNLMVELKPCQHLTDYLLRLTK